MEKDTHTPTCRTCDRKVKRDGDQCPVCKRLADELKRQERGVAARKKRRKAKR